MREGKQVYIYRVCYIHLIIHYFWFSSYCPVEISYTNAALLSSAAFMLLLSNILFFKCPRPKNKVIYISL